MTPRKYIVFAIDAQFFGVRLSRATSIHGMSDSWLATDSTVVPFARPSQPAAIVDLRARLGMPSFQEQTEALIHLMEARDRDHVNWLIQLRNSLTSERPFNLPLDPSRCAFGQWYDRVSQPGPEREALVGSSTVLGGILDSFDEPHRSIHALGEEVLSLAPRNPGQSVVRLYEACDTTLLRLRCRLKEFIESLRTLRAQSLLLLNHNGQLVGMPVDSVQATVRALEVAPTAPPFVRGHIECEGRLAAVLDLDVLLEAGTLLTAARAA